MAHSISNSVDVAIVGGGIVGCAVAWQLAEAGAKVAVFERATVASEQSSRAWGFIRQQGRNPAELPLAVEANRLWAELTQRYGQEATHFTQRGILVPAETAADEDRVVRGHEVARKFDLDTRLVDRSELARLLPELHGDWRCALFTSQDGHGDPLVSTRTIAEAARQAGAEIFERHPVIEIGLEDGRISGVTTHDGLCRAGAVVIAAGIGSPRLARRLGLDVPIQVITSSVGQTRPADRFTEIATWAPAWPIGRDPTAASSSATAIAASARTTTSRPSRSAICAISCPPMPATGAYCGSPSATISSPSSGAC